jgi:hypothetical protein
MMYYGQLTRSGPVVQHLAAPLLVRDDIYCHSERLDWGRASPGSRQLAIALSSHALLTNAELVERVERMITSKRFIVVEAEAREAGRATTDHVAWLCHERVYINYVRRLPRDRFAATQDEVARVVLSGVLHTFQ